MPHEGVGKKPANGREGAVALPYDGGHCRYGFRRGGVPPPPADSQPRAPMPHEGVGK